MTFRVNIERCVKCGKCVKDCPTNTLEMRDGVPFYAMLFGNPAVDYIHCVDRSSAARVIYR